jgi:thiol-disulfide isomerase/thioredoxin
MADSELASGLPTAAEILEKHRENRRRLSPLHLQMLHVYHRIEPEAHYVQHLGEKRARRQIIKPLRIVEPLEFFVRGKQCQRRQPNQIERTDAAAAAWRFPTERLSAESLLTVYRSVNIFSCSPTSSPPVRVWEGADHPAYISQLHLDDSLLHAPAMVDVGHGEFTTLHPIDAFFSLPADEYHVVRQEIIDGRELTVVQLGTAHGDPLQQAARRTIEFEGKVQAAIAKAPPDSREVVVESGPAVFNPAHAGGRPGTWAWIDLARGALPMRIETPLAEVMITERIAELSSGAFYPAKTVFESRRADPKKPISSEQWAEIAAGKRKPDLIVHNRMSWDCSLVELIPDLDDRFFILPFPPGQQIWDQDTEKVVGALELKPRVAVGQPAPAWTIGRWVDGQERTLEGLRGQVVVLDFWSGGFGKNFEIRMPHLKTLMDRFAGQPVTFITIHLAERDQAALAAKIVESQKRHQFSYIAAIDAGRMAEDSVTRCEYGVGRCMDRVIIGRDGKIAYVDPEVRGPACSERDPKILAEFKERFDRHWQERFEAVGVRWRPSKWLGSIKKFFLCQKVETLYIGQQIEKALAAGR